MWQFLSSPNKTLIQSPNMKLRVTLYKNILMKIKLFSHLRIFIWMFFRKERCFFYCFTIFWDGSGFLCVKFSLKWLVIFLKVIHAIFSTKRLPPPFPKQFPYLCRICFRFFILTVTNVFWANKTKYMSPN